VAEQRKGITAATLLLALVPLILLGGVVYVLLTAGPDRLFNTGLPAVEDLHVSRHVLAEDVIHLDVINSGPDPVTIAQVMVRGAFWYHEVEPERKIEPLHTARVSIPFPWNFGEPVEIGLLTSTGLVFDYEIEVASVTPRATLGTLGRFALLGIFVGVIPVALGITWFPFLRRLGKRSISFLLYLTVGLLAFLAVDAVFEGFEVASGLPGVYHAQALLVLGFAGALLVLLGVEIQARKNREAASGVVVAWLVALGIGLHNLGEGLAIGSAYVLGEVTLGALLVVGFTLHNATEGIAIVAPILNEGAPIRRLIGLGALAGVPTILGCWLGAFTYSQIWALLFLGVGAGAIVQVIGAIVGRKPLAETLAPLNLFGLLMGYGLMYGTGLIVGAA
jgi:ZIP family zinc transporter